MIEAETPAPQVAAKIGVSVRTIERWKQKQFAPRKGSITEEQWQEIETLLARYTKRGLRWAFIKVTGITDASSLTAIYAKRKQRELRLSVIEDNEVTQ